MDTIQINLGYHSTNKVEWDDYSRLATKLNLPATLQTIIPNYQPEEGFPNDETRFYFLTFKEFNKLFYSDYVFDATEADIYEEALIKIKEVINAEYGLSIVGYTSFEYMPLPNCPDDRSKYLSLKAAFLKENLKIPTSYSMNGAFFILVFLFLCASLTLSLISVFVFSFHPDVIAFFLLYLCSIFIVSKITDYCVVAKENILSFSYGLANLNSAYFLKSRNLTKKEALRFTFDMFHRNNKMPLSDKSYEDIDFHIRITINEPSLV